MKAIPFITSILSIWIIHNVQAQDIYEAAKILASDRGEEQAFGISVSLSGNTALIGSLRSFGYATSSEFLPSAGCAYFF